MVSRALQAPPLVSTSAGFWFPRIQRHKAQAFVCRSERLRDGFVKKPRLDQKPRLDLVRAGELGGEGEAEHNVRPADAGHVSTTSSLGDVLIPGNNLCVDQGELPCMVRVAQHEYVGVLCQPCAVEKKRSDGMVEADGEVEEEEEAVVEADEVTVADAEALADADAATDGVGVRVADVAGRGSGR